MKLIQGFNIDSSNLPVLSTLRQFSVQGEEGAEFMLQVVNSSQQFYNFSSRSFTSTFNSENNLNVKMKSDVYNNSITFPANASGDTYIILLLTGTGEDTELSIDNSSNKKSHSTTITQPVNTTLTFTVATANTSDYTSWSSGDNITSAAAPETTFSTSKTLDWTLTNASTDGNGFGLRLTRQPIDTDWYFTTTDTVDRSPLTTRTDTVNGATDDSTSVTMDNSSADLGIVVGDYVFGTGVTVGTTVVATPSEKVITLSDAMTISDEVTLTFLTANTEVIVDDLTDIATGMYITAVSGTNAYLIGTPTITAINTSTNTLTLSTVQAFVDGTTLTFQARGNSVIKKATGANIDFSNWKATVTSAAANELTKTVRTTASGTTVNLNGTYGVAGGGFVTIAGSGIKNTSANTVQTVSASSAAGSMVMEVAQTVSSGTKLTFTGSTQSIDIDNTFVVKSNPSADQTIYLNLDNFITPGVSGS